MIQQTFDKKKPIQTTKTQMIMKILSDLVTVAACLLLLESYLEASVDL